jgi:hypothetical protein
VVGKLVQKQERDSFIQKEKQYTKNTETQDTQNRKQKSKQGNKQKRIIKNISNYKIIKGANNNEPTYCTEPT